MKYEYFMCLPYKIARSAYVYLFVFFICCSASSQHNISLDSLCNLYAEDTLISYLCIDFNLTNIDLTKDQKMNLGHRIDSIGTLYIQKAKYKRAAHLFEISSGYWKELNQTKELSSSLILLGRTYYRQGNIFDSFRNINKGLLIAQELDYKELEGLGHLYLSWNYWRIRQCNDALSQLLHLKEQIDLEEVSIDLVAGYYNARAKYEFCLGRESNSIIMSDSAINFARINKLRRMESVAMSNKVNYLLENGSFEEKIALVDAAIAINREQNDKEQLGSNLGLLGKVYLNSGMYKESLFVGLQALKIAKEINDKPRIYRAHNVCRRAYAGLKDFSNAYLHERDARLMGDEIYGLSHIDKIFGLQKAKDNAEQEQKLMQIAAERELQQLKIAQERKMYAISFAAMVLLLIGGVLYWFSYKHNKEKETQLVKEVLENEMRELELQSLRALMNPHFIFNSLNSIKGFIIRNEPEVAADYLNKFSHLIRLILSNSQKPLITLSEELKALEMYIQLEGLRLEGKFDYSIQIKEGIKTDSIQVAPMIIQPFVENAIWHGLMSKPGVKILNIDIRKRGEGIEIVIKDNGVGRKVSQNRRQSFGVKKKSYGMKITENRIKFAQQANEVIVKDLVDANNEAIGTEVVIQLNLKNHD